MSEPSANMASPGNSGFNNNPSPWTPYGLYGERQGNHLHPQFNRRQVPGNGPEVGLHHPFVGGNHPFALNVNHGMGPQGTSPNGFYLDQFGRIMPHHGMGYGWQNRPPVYHVAPASLTNTPGQFYINQPEYGHPSMFQGHQQHAFPSESIVEGSYEATTVTTFASSPPGSGEPDYQATAIDGLPLTPSESSNEDTSPRRTPELRPMTEEMHERRINLESLVTTPVTARRIFSCTHPGCTSTFNHKERLNRHIA
jgi:hypothetical protein